MLSGLAASGEAAVAAQFVDVNQSADAANALAFRTLRHGVENFCACTSR